METFGAVALPTSITAAQVDSSSLSLSLTRFICVASSLRTLTGIPRNSVVQISELHLSQLVLTPTDSSSVSSQDPGEKLRL